MKEKHGRDTKFVTLTPTIKSGTVYTLDISQYGDADDIASISKQAASFNKSEISVSSGRNVYTFQDVIKTNGMEDVQITLVEPARGGITGGPGGCFGGGTEAVIDIHFTITP
jgi:hypothetical protein